MRLLRRTCVLCGRIERRENMKGTNKNRNWNLVLTASLSMAGQFDRSNITKLTENITAAGRYICSCHAVQAAQYLYAEVVSAGSSLSSGKYGSIRTSMLHSYAIDIPQNLVETLNWISKTVAITAEDVRAFMNATKKKYYGTVMWPIHEEEEEERLEEAVPYATTNGLGTAIEPGAADKVEEDAQVSMGKWWSRLMVEDCAERDNEAFSKMAEEHDYEPGSSDSASGCEADVGETDPASLHKYYLVQGSLLMSLFRFCPECGHRLGKAQLNAVGTAAVVRFVCRVCSVRPAVKNWESQAHAVSSSKGMGV